MIQSFSITLRNLNIHTMKRLIQTLFLLTLFVTIAISSSAQSRFGTKFSNSSQNTKDDWWRPKAEKVTSDNPEEPFQEDIFADPELDELDLYNNPRNRGFTTRGITSNKNRRRTTTTRSRNRPEEFSQKTPKRILSETEVPVEVAQREVQLLPNNFNGFMIQIMQSPQELPSDHDIFFKHGNLMVENNSGAYAYLLGKFTDRDEAERFLDEIILPQYPSASVVEYSYGQRTN